MFTTSLMFKEFQGHFHTLTRAKCILNKILNTL